MQFYFLTISYFDFGLFSKKAILMTISAIILIILILGFIRSGTLGYEIIACFCNLGIITIIALQESVMIFLAKSLGIVSPRHFLA